MLSRDAAASAACAANADGSIQPSGNRCNVSAGPRDAETHHASAPLVQPLNRDADLLRRRRRPVTRGRATSVAASAACAASAHRGDRRAGWRSPLPCDASKQAAPVERAALVADARELQAHARPIGAAQVVLRPGRRWTARPDQPRRPSRCWSAPASSRRARRWARPGHREARGSGAPLRPALRAPPDRRRADGASARRPRRSTSSHRARARWGRVPAFSRSSPGR